MGKDGVKGREHKIRADKVDVIERKSGEGIEEEVEAPVSRQTTKILKSQPEKLQ